MYGVDRVRFGQWSKHITNLHKEVDLRLIQLLVIIALKVGIVYMKLIHKGTGSNNNWKNQKFDTGLLNAPLVNDSWGPAGI